MFNLSLVARSSGFHGTFTVADISHHGFRQAERKITFL
jgi:hypothetical protein